MKVGTERATISFDTISIAFIALAHLLTGATYVAFALFSENESYLSLLIMFLFLSGWIFDVISKQETAKLLKAFGIFIFLAYFVLGVIYLISHLLYRDIQNFPTLYHGTMLLGIGLVGLINSAWYGFCLYYSRKNDESNELDIPRVHVISHKTKKYK